MKDWKGFGTSRDPNIPSLFIQRLFPLEILGFANKGHITHYRAQDSGTAVGGGGFCCHLRRDLHTLVSKGMRYMNPECPEIQPGLQKTKCELH